MICTDHTKQNFSFYLSHFHSSSLYRTLGIFSLMLAPDQVFNSQYILLHFISVSKFWNGEC